MAEETVRSPNTVRNVCFVRKYEDFKNTTSHGREGWNISLQDELYFHQQICLLHQETRLNLKTHPVSSGLLC